MYHEVRMYYVYITYINTYIARVANTLIMGIVTAVSS